MKDKNYKFIHEQTLKDINYDTIKIVNLRGKKYSAHQCGYVTPSGTYFTCQPYHHLHLLENMFRYGEFKDMWKAFYEKCSEENIEACNLGTYSDFDLFAMVELGWVKIAAYMSHNEHNNSTTIENAWYDWKMERVYDLTPAQIDAIYKK